MGIRSNLKRGVAIAGCTTLLLSPLSCKTTEGQKGAGLGAIVGGLAGALITGDSKGAAIGAAIGAGAGYAGGNEIDKADAETERAQIMRDANTVVVNIHNSNGSITPIQLTRSRDGYYWGPRGEMYTTIPTEGQLKPVYGLDRQAF